MTIGNCADIFYCRTDGAKPDPQSQEESMTIARFSMGTGDRFGREGVAQVAAFEKIKADGVDVAIVWNKSNREHTIIGTSPADQRAAADAAAAAAASAAAR